MEDQEDQHYATFADNDFINGVWKNGEFYATGQNKGRVQTRDEALYGYQSSDSDGENDGRKRRRKMGEEKDFSRPVGFVSGGITGSSTEKPKEVEQAEADLSRRQSEGNGLGFGGAGLGLGASDGGMPRGGLGLGFAPAQSGVDDLNGRETDANGDSDDDWHANLPTTFGRAVAEGASQRMNQKKAQEKRATEERRQTNKFASTSQSEPLPSFAKNTAAANMMAKMGYKPGKGLGKNEQGITASLTVKQRPKNEGLGHRDYEHQLDFEAKAKTTQKPIEAKEKKVDLKLWKKNRAAERIQREYKTAEEVLAEQSEKGTAAPVVQQTILDMRGPQARVITDMEELTTGGQLTAEDDIPMPELQHNLRVMVDLAAADIQRLDGKLRHSKDTAVILSREAEQLKLEAATAEERSDRLKLVMERVNQAEQAASNLSLQDLQQIYSGLKADFAEEYVMYDLPAVALTQVLPRIFAVMAGSSPLSKPSQGLQEIATWRPLLESSKQANAMYADVDPSADPFSTLLTMTVVPGLQSAVTNLWDPRDPEPMLVWLETWRDVLPTNIQLTILETLIFPKVSRALDAWDPLQDTIPVHAWLHPWLPWLGPRLEVLYPTIRFRLSRALQAWHPQDGSALALLLPWHKVFEEKDWNDLMVRSIIPRLATALDGFLVNSAEQDMTPFYWVTSWAAVIHPVHMVNLLEAHFFPQWHSKLHFWLSHSPDYNEVSNWYLNWKTQIPAEIQGHERIQAHFGAALEMIDAAMDNRALPMHSTGPVSDPYATAAASAPQATSFSRWGGGTVAQASAEPTLVDIVQTFANAHNLAFLPKNRRHEGLQVYGFGAVSVILDSVNNMIRTQVEGGSWKLISLEDLLAENARRSAQQKP